MKWKWKTILSFGINFVKNKKESNENNTKVLTKKFRELMGKVKSMKMSGELDKKSIDALKGQISSIQNAGRELQHNLKESSDITISIQKLGQERANLREEEDVLKQQNNRLDELEKKVKDKDKKEIIDKKRTINNKKLTEIEKKLNKNEAQIKSFSTGEKTREFGVNIQNSLNKFKMEIAKLETQVTSLEKGQALKPPQQNIMDQPIPKGLKLQAPLKPNWRDRDAEKKEKASNDKGEGIRL